MLPQTVLFIADILPGLPRQIIPVAKVVGYEVLLHNRMDEKPGELANPKSRKTHFILKHQNDFKGNANCVIRHQGCYSRLPSLSHSSHYSTLDTHCTIEIVEESEKLEKMIGFNNDLLNIGVKLCD